jgi:hypothetical protein
MDQMETEPVDVDSSVPTRKERRYIDLLGTGAWMKVPPHETKHERRVRLLKLYIKSLDLRKEWSGIDPLEIRAYAEKALEKENG